MPDDRFSFNEALHLIPLNLSGVAAAAGTAGGPELPGLAAPVVHVDGCEWKTSQSIN
jgi:hypothetical protein